MKIHHQGRTPCALHLAALSLLPLLHSCIASRSALYEHPVGKKEPSGLLILSIGDTATRRHFDCWLRVPIEDSTRSSGVPNYKEAKPLNESFVEREGFLSHLEKTIQNEASLRQSYGLKANAARALDKVLGQIITGDVVGALPALPSAAFSLGIGLVEGRLEQQRVAAHIDRNVSKALDESEKNEAWLLLMPDSDTPSLSVVESRFFEALDIALATAPRSLIRVPPEFDSDPKSESDTLCRNHLDRVLDAKPSETQNPTESDRAPIGRAKQL